MGKVIAKRPKKVTHDCLHCDLQFDFPVAYCPVCEQHMHEMFVGTDFEKRGMCSHCWHGCNKKARDWWRAQRKWGPTGYAKTDYDDPEWCDMLEEWKSSTVMLIWIPK